MCQVVLVVRILQRFSNLVRVLRLLIDRGVHGPQEGTPHDLGPDVGVRIQHAEPRLELLAYGFLEPRLVPLADQAVAENAAHLVVPQPRERLCAGHMHRLDHQKTLEHLGHVSQIEGVVRPGRRGEQLVPALVVEVDSATHGGIAQGLNLLLEPRQEAVYDGAENRGHGLLARRGHAEHQRVPREARSHAVAAAARGRGAEQQRGVLDLLPVVLLAVEEAPQVLELPEQLDGRLGPVLLDQGHVHVVDEDHDRLVHRSP
mmetsp:Transcript_42095/g.120857  ORF Transcript_42095/g.120857 Transcript_42095/m.120857 type:complete len:259 (-) Transcript_42095:2891-3667(-)